MLWVANERCSQSPLQRDGDCEVPKSCSRCKVNCFFACLLIGLSGDKSINQQITNLLPSVRPCSSLVVGAGSNVGSNVGSKSANLASLLSPVHTSGIR
jgi:hypothetical protein